MGFGPVSEPYVLDLLPLRNLYSHELQFAYHTIGIRKAFLDVTAAENLPVRLKVSEYSSACGLLTLVQVFELFGTHELANLGRIVTEVVSALSSSSYHPGTDSVLGRFCRLSGNAPDCCESEHRRRTR